MVELNEWPFGMILEEVEKVTRSRSKDSTCVQFHHHDLAIQQNWAIRKTLDNVLYILYADFGVLEHMYTTIQSGT